MLLKTLNVGKWTLNFDKAYRVIKDDTSVVILDNDREAIVVLSLSQDGNLKIERTYYAMIYEFVLDSNTINFLSIED